MKRRKPKGPNRKPAAPDFPALRDFFAGYLHQDFRDEYDSPAAAAKAFCAEANAPELAAVRREWAAWRKQLGQPTAESAAVAIRALGGAWAPQKTADLAEMEQILRFFTRTPLREGGL